MCMVVEMAHIGPNLVSRAWQTNSDGSLSSRLIDRMFGNVLIQGAKFAFPRSLERGSASLGPLTIYSQEYHNFYIAY